MKRVKLLCIAGTRPEAIKMAPVIQALHEEPWADCRVLATAQHRQMLDQVLRLFDIAADIDLDIMRPNQALNALTARLLLDLDAALEVESPDAVLAQGDTTTVMSAALACFHRRIPFGHVEAGLRTGDLGNPFPEEMNRVIASRLARWHFAPTERSRANRHLADIYADVQVLYPVHPNPNVRELAHALLGGHERITLGEPLDYAAFVGAMQRAYLIPVSYTHLTLPTSDLV